MGFVGFLKFSLKCSDVLAWPLFALGYPLCASIRAIETNSNYHMRKLVTYWIVFSLIALFELAFMKLIEWVPFWPCLKIIAICWLAIPDFNGAYYVYKFLVHPCLSVNLSEVFHNTLQVVSNWLNKPKEDFSLKTETFLAGVERYVKENGTEALEKLIPNKATKPSLDVEEIKSVETMEKKEVATTAKSMCKDPNFAEKDFKVELAEKNAEAAAKGGKGSDNLAQSEKRTVAAVEVKEMTVPTTGGEDALPEKPASKNVQKEWTCAVCQVTTTCETNLNSHLQGKKHMAKCEELMQAAKNKGSSSLTANRTDQANQDPKKGVYGSGPNQNKTSKQEEKVKANANSEQCIQKKWICVVCNVRTLSETTLNSHLQGKKHKSKCEELKASKQAAKNNGSSSSTANKSDQANQDPRKYVSGAVPHQNKTQKQEEKVQVNANGEQCKQKKQRNADAYTQQSKYWCSICKVRCPGEIDMSAHVNGRKHLSLIQEMINFSGSLQGGSGSM